MCCDEGLRNVRSSRIEGGEREEMDWTKTIVFTIHKYGKFHTENLLQKILRESLGIRSGWLPFPYRIVIPINVMEAFKRPTYRTLKKPL